MNEIEVYVLIVLFINLAITVKVVLSKKNIVSAKKYQILMIWILPVIGAMIIYVFLKFLDHTSRHEKLNTMKSNPHVEAQTSIVETSDY